MKKLFRALNSRNFEAVKALVEQEPLLVNSISKALVKRDEGQSPLRVAVKNSSFDIAEYLVAKGADINFYTVEDGMYIIHQAAYTVFRRSIPSATYEGTFDESFSILSLLLSKNVDLSVRNSSGFSCFQSALGVSRGCIYSDIKGHKLPNNNEWCSRAKSVFLLLASRGVDTSLPEQWVGMAAYEQWRLNILSLCGMQPYPPNHLN